MSEYSATTSTTNTTPPADATTTTATPSKPKSAARRPNDPEVHRLVNSHPHLAKQAANAAYAEARSFGTRGVDRHRILDDAFRLLWSAARYWNSAKTPEFADFATPFVTINLRKRILEPKRYTTDAPGGPAPEEVEYPDEFDAATYEMEFTDHLSDLGATHQEAMLLHRVIVMKESRLDAVQYVYDNAGGSRQAACERVDRVLAKFRDQLQLAGYKASADDLSVSA